MSFIIFLILFFSIGAVDHEIPLQITIDNVRSDKGIITVSVFLDQESFEAEKPFLNRSFPKLDHVEGDIYTCSIDLPEGIYGIVVLDDENSDLNMNYNWMGIPKEGYGFSNFIHKGFSKPIYSDFDFELNAQSQEMNITLRYF